MIMNHEPKPLSAAVAQKLTDGGYADYVRKHPIAAVGAPNGLVNPEGKRKDVENTDNHVTYPLTQPQYEHSRNHLIGYNDSYDRPARIVRAKAENILDVSERKEPISIRNYNVTPQLPPNGLTVAELFCGGGLMAVGLKAAGYDLIFANDFDKNAVKAYAYNLGDHVVQGDVASDEIQAQIPDADIIAGGPPCQDYSVAGAGAGEEGARGKLVWTYLATIQRKQPKAFVFENVKGLLTKKHRPTFDALLERFDEIGYTVSWRLINAWDYGVAQKRERVFIVGIRKDLGFTFEFPEPEASGYRTQVLRDVIGDLPEPNTGVNGHIQTQATTVKRTEGVYNQRAYKADWDTPAKTVCTNRLDHAEIHPGPRNHDAKSFWTPPGGREYTYDQANRVQSMDSASNTIPAHHNSGQPIHPMQAPRRFTVRECLRIQSVPDSYVLPDTISLSAQYRIVGNGVASRVAYVIGEALAAQLNAVLTEVPAYDAAA